MLIKDIYGEFEINEPVLIELINSQPVQRLKNIGQHLSIFPEFWMFPSYTRYEHSIGVMLFLRKIEASLEEQVAGLLHDISHTAFSHIIDWVIGSSEKEDFQDNNHEKIIMNSEIPQILQKYRIEINKIVHYGDYFKLLERKIPDLCADRIDYSIREMHSWADKENVTKYLNSMIALNNKIIFNSKEAARGFANSFLKIQKEHWASTEQMLKYYLFAEIFKKALEEKILNLEDFFTDDIVVMDKLKKANNEEINKILKYLKEIRYKITEESGIKLKKKFRYVDPEFVEDKNVYRLSEADNNFKTLIENLEEEAKNGINVELLRN